MSGGWGPKDITVVSAARIDPRDTAPNRVSLVRKHLEWQSHLDCPAIFVHLGIGSGLEYPKSKNLFVHEIERSEWDESRAKNIGLAWVETPLVAFTNADTLISASALYLTLKRCPPGSFILQGYRWEIPRLVPVPLDLYAGESSRERRHLLAEMIALSVPHAGGKLAMGEWQVCPTELARSIGGFDEGMKGYGGMDTDFHERARAAALMAGGVEILTRDIPVLHQYHYAERPRSPNHERRYANITRFLRERTPESLKWQPV